MALRGASEPVAVCARAAADAWGPTYGEATLLGVPVTAGIADAAMLNGIAGHALDYDDTSVSAFSGHPSAPLWPALLALAELRDLPGAEVLRAFCVAVRTGSRLGAWCNPSHYAAGWHATATLGTCAAAAGCAALLDLDHHRTSLALGLASAQASGLRVAFGTPAKPLQVGQAAANGLRCALLAAAGTGLPADALDAPNGFMQTHAVAPGDLPDDGLDAIRVKYHAACHSTHAAIEAATATGAAAAQIARVEVRAASTLADVCGIEAPRTGLEAKFSLRATTALALLGADTGDPGCFTDGAVHDMAYRALLERVSVVYTPRLTEYEAQVTVTLTDGSRVQRRADLAATEALSERSGRVPAKFARLAGRVLGDDAAAQVAGLIAGLEQLPSVRPLLSLCRTAAP